MWSANSTPPTDLFANEDSWIVITTRSAGTLQVSTTTSVIPLHRARFCSIVRPSFSSIVISGTVVLPACYTRSELLGGAAVRRSPAVAWAYRSFAGAGVGLCQLRTCPEQAVAW